MAVTGFEQFAVGQSFTSGTVMIEAAAIKAFAQQFDPQAQHLDEEAAKQSLFGTLVASGWHTASLTMRLIMDSALVALRGRGMGVKVNEMTWSAPVHPGDRLHAVSEVLAVRPSQSKPDRGLVVMRTTTHNQHDVAVQVITSTLLVLRSDG